jgi:hypothetical protein
MVFILSKIAIKFTLNLSISLRSGLCLINAFNAFCGVCTISFILKWQVSFGCENSHLD